MSHPHAGSTRFSSISTPGAKASLSDEEIAIYNSLLTQAKSKLHSERERESVFSLSTLHCVDRVIFDCWLTVNAEFSLTHHELFYKRNVVSCPQIS